MYSKPIHTLIRALSRLPSVGPRTAERFVFFLLKSGKKEVADLSLALQELMHTVRSCEVCWDFSDRTPCAICSNKKRDWATIAVVAEPQDLQAIEKIGSYTGVYHILRGTLSADMEGRNNGIKIQELFKRLKAMPIKEVILALNPNMDGETTMMYLEAEIKRNFPTVIVSRLARGLPSGSELQYADEITLENALRSRTVLK
ncbi:MAG: recombination protein RecR [Candidatus Magasanikbacteria bacterium RIFCSPHIGHO2_02_FULL_41_13]|uniref:Recombination protein RecR n=1 Tax=Candidatus Magasanikbacteria bacterium RIFCSPHIGHO2_02_FULL_41_13 TaxID=1798676 RepID=A0A1F6M480_9BACT|nr:MAG: recombination protein RecR [Candidatus Magasanikbacteria bacterium RIFCSPHIGHO2_02_FULL_41_13]